MKYCLKILNTELSSAVFSTLWAFDLGSTMHYAVQDSKANADVLSGFILSAAAAAVG